MSDEITPRLTRGEIFDLMLFIKTRLAEPDCPDSERERFSYISDKLAALFEATPKLGEEEDFSGN